MIDSRSAGRGGRNERRSDLEAKFDYYYRAFAGDEFPTPDAEYKFKNWRVDRAFPDCRIAVELNGGAGGGYGSPVVCHNCGVRVRARTKDGRVGRELRLPYPSHSGKGAERDAEKANALAAAGWTLLTFTSAQIDSDPAGCIGTVVRFLKDCASARLERRAERKAADVLTPREVEILKEIARGKTSQAIAFQLGVSARTVETHVHHIREKLGVPSIAAATAIAVHLGVIGVEWSPPNRTDFLESV